MRFERVRIEAFGRLSGVDTGDDPLADLVVVDGRNEAGKSTFFEWLASSLYGFSPATRDGHPYSPWGGANAEGTVWIRTGGGERVEVVRRLLSSPAGSIVRGEVSEDLRNRTLPFVEHVPATIFRQVFALRLAELAALDGSGWEAVQDRLLGAFGATDLRPAREVADELQQEAGKLWRTDRRGRQEIRELDERRSELRYRRSDAAREERAIREANARLGETRARLAEARTERERAREFVERYRALLPIRETLERIEGLRADAGDPELLAGLPGDPAAALAEARETAERIHRRLRSLERDRARPREAVQAFGVHEETLLAKEGEIQGFLRRAATAERLRLRRTQLETEIRDLERRLESGAARSLGGGLDADRIAAIRALPVPRIRDALEGVRKVRAERPPEAAVDEVAGGGPEIGGRGPENRPGSGADRGATFALGVAGIGGLLLVAGVLLGGNLWALVAGGVLAAGGAVRWLGERDRRAEAERRRAAEVEARAEATRRHAAWRARAAEVEARLAELLAPLGEGIGAGTVADDLPAELGRFQDWLRELEDRRGELEELGTELTGIEAEARELARLDTDLSADPASLAHDLPNLLSEASRRREAAAAGRRELARLDELLEEARADRERIETELGSLTRTLEVLGGGDPETGLERAAERIRARDRAGQLLDELERGHPNLDEIRARIRAAEEAGEDWTIDPDAVARQKARETTLSDEIEELQGRARALEKEVEHLQERVLVDEIDGELAELAERRERLVRRRDRLHLLGRILRDAERVLREEHQPELLRRASGFLTRLTGGRYDRLLLGGRDGRDFRVRGPATPEPLAIDHPLSTGTREQIYLALRLAILDHLDRAGERLPLILDEVMVNWDEERRTAGLELLAELSARRQIFFFTCHDEMVDALVRAGAQRIRLEPS